jgi:uncharacterized protein
LNSQFWPIKTEIPGKCGMAGPTFQILAGAGSGLAGGLLSGMFGIGGGIVLVPLLALALHLDQHQAQGVSLAAMLLPNGLPAVLHYRKRGVPIHWKLVGWMVVGFLPGILGGSWIANRIPNGPLRIGFAGFLVLMALRTLLVKPNPLPLEVSEAGPDFDSRAGLVIGIAGGVAGGLLGIGGGLVMIPLMVWWLGFSQREAQLQSLALLLPPLGLPGVLVYAAAQGGLPWLVLAGLAAGFALGGYLGARVATAIKAAELSRGFAVLMFLMAVLMAWRR